MVSDFAQAYVNAAGMVIKIGGDASITALNNTHALALSGSAALAQSDTAKSNVGVAGAYSMNMLGGEARAEVMAVGELAVTANLALAARRTGVAVTIAAGMAGAKGQKGVAVAGSAAVGVADYANIAVLSNAAKVSARDITIQARDLSVLATHQQRRGGHPPGDRPAVHGPRGRVGGIHAAGRGLCRRVRHGARWRGRGRLGGRHRGVQPH
ncbi:hypothetical protein G6F24_015012 [Rhizopus arrhizus]|nr:hypothetical protein G6F24_015012 [Rhizopus arrhizus]